ncbi:MAG: DNA recombination protein RmuC [Firmicutes bacterium]|nr:DNA recombination protein RmuC [Bacillota bacterium]
MAERLNHELREVAEARARAEQEARRVPDFLAELAAARRRAEELQVQVAESAARLEASERAAAWQEQAAQHLQAAFKALAADLLQTNAQQFLGQASAQLAQLVDPVKAALAAFEQHVRHLEAQREGAYQGLQSQVQMLQSTTATLAQALKSASARGQWGEVQLRRLVELAGMVKHVDFAEQHVTDEGRPDLVVHLPKGGVLAVDAKTPMQAFLEAMESSDEPVRTSRLAAHARALRQHVQQLASKRYWEQFEHAPEVVVLFIPNDGCLAAAFERDPGLLEDALRQRVLLATPVVLLALLKAVAYGWQQHEVAEHAREIAEHGRQLYARLADFLERFHLAGRRLDSAVKYYNEAVGSLERRVLPAARRLKELGLGGDELHAPPEVVRTPRIALSESLEAAPLPVPVPEEPPESGGRNGHADRA